MFNTFIIPVYEGPTKEREVGTEKHQTQGIDITNPYGTLLFGFPVLARKRPASFPILHICHQIAGQTNRPLNVTNYIILALPVTVKRVVNSGS